MPAPTPEALRAALVAHRSPAAAFAALGITKQGVYFKRGGAHIHPDLVAVLREHAKATADKAPRNASGKQGLHKVRLPRSAVAYLDTLAAKARPRGSRSAVAREMIQEALLGPLPAPEDASGEYVVLDLGPAWTDLAARLGTDDPREVGGTVRAILVKPRKKPGASKKE